MRLGGGKIFGSNREGNIIEHLKGLLMNSVAELRFCSPKLKRVTFCRKKLRLKYAKAEEEE